MEIFVKCSAWASRSQGRHQTHKSQNLKSGSLKEGSRRAIGQTSREFSEEASCHSVKLEGEAFQARCKEVGVV